MNATGRIYCHAAGSFIDPSDEENARSVARFLSDMKGAEFRVYINEGSGECYVSGDLCWSVLKATPGLRLLQTYDSE